jgi:hypothetical protein
MEAEIKDTMLIAGPEVIAKRASHREPLHVTIALTAKWSSYPDRLRWIAEHGFALEYAPNPEALDALAGQIAPYVERGVPVRYHGFLPGYELGHKDPELAELGTLTHMALLDAMHGLGEQVVTFHVGLKSQDPIAPGLAIGNLTRVVEHGRNLGITVCLENLRRGPTSDPRKVAAWAEASGAKTTFDIGHAVESQLVKDGELTTLEFLEIMADRLHEVHMYERETDRHHPPKDMHIIGPIVDRLLQTDCRWWTIELDDYEESLATRKLLIDYLQAA